jgi:hypothetical protein
LSKRYALFIGRWQPPHPGHEWLVRQQLDKGVPCAIAVRPTNEYLTTKAVIRRLEELFAGEDVVVFPLPVDVGSVNYGRGVGYDIVEHTPPEDVAAISATAIRGRT